MDPSARRMRALSAAASLAVVGALLITAPALAQTPGAPPTAFETAIGEAKSNMMADPPTALARAQEAEAEAGGDAASVATALWLQGEALNRLNRPMEAAPLLERALATVSEAAPGSKLQGDLYVARAGAARAHGDYTTALSSFQSAHEVFAKLGEARSQSIALGQIGSIYTDAGDYQRALDYYAKAGEVFGGDPAIDLSRFNNIANAYKELGRYSEAEEGYRDALAIAETMNSPLLRMRILTNIASVQLLEGRHAQADLTALTALNGAEAGKPLGWEPFLWGVRAEAAFARGDVGRAASLIARTFEGQDLANTTMPFRDFHSAAYRIFNRRGDAARALVHLEAFKRLDDEARNVMASANLALMGAQFDFATQELQIANLRSETLEKQIALQQARARQRQVIASGLGVLGLLTLIGGGVYFRQVVRSRNEIRAANEQLSQSNVKLEKALKAKSEFLATTSHEIRTPLNGILGMTQLMLQQRGLSAELKERVQLVHGAGETMRAIVDDILDVSKMETGAVRIVVDPFDMRRMMTDVAHLWRDSATNKGLTLEADLAGCPADFPGDEQRLRQIVFNLLSNAVKFTDAGGVRLTVRCLNGPDERRLEIEVADTGIGVPEHEIEEIFKPFHQVDGGKTRRHGGTGLGLAICRSLADAMGGQVTARSVVGEGSVFTLKLPLPEDYAPRLASGGAEGPVETGGVLYIDANPLNPFILGPVLAEAGVEVVTVDALADAAFAVARRRFDSIAVAPAGLGEDPGEAMSALLALKECVGDARLVVWLDETAGLQAPMLRLCGVDEVVEGEFDAAALGALLLGAAPAQGEIPQAG